MKLRVPSLQHLARNWRSEASLIARELVKLGLNPPTFSYNPLFGAIRDRLLLGQSFAEIEKGFVRAIKREGVRANLLEVLALIEEHFATISPTFIQGVARRYYPVGRGLMVPFEPPVIYGTSGAIEFPWFTFWKSNPLADERLSLFVTLVREILLQDPDLEEANFKILDFSAPLRSKNRVLTIVDAREIPDVSASRKREMLDVFAEGFQLAAAEMINHDRPRKDEAEKPDDGQPDMFDDGPPSPR